MQGGNTRLWLSHGLTYIASHRPVSREQQVRSILTKTFFLYRLLGDHDYSITTYVAWNSEFNRVFTEYFWLTDKLRWNFEKENIIWIQSQFIDSIISFAVYNPSNRHLLEMTNLCARLRGILLHSQIDWPTILNHEETISTDFQRIWHCFKQFEAVTKQISDDNMNSIGFERWPNDF